MDFKIENLPEQPVIGVRFKTSMDKIAEDIGKGYSTLFGFLGRKEVAPVGPPLALYYDEQMNEAAIDMEACVPVAGPVEAEGEIVYHALPACRCATAVHMGPYDTMKETYEAMLKWFESEGLKPLAPMWEEYLNDPCQVERPEDIMTRIVWPVE